jgi:hypothetical protein
LRDTSFAAQWFVLGTLAITGTAIGLLISALSKTEDMAATIVPLILIPQIILAGVVAPVEGFARFLAGTFVSAYWGYSSLATYLPEDLRTYLGVDSWSGGWCYAMLLVHLLTIVGTTVAILTVGGNRDLAYGKPLDKWMLIAKSRLQEALSKRRNEGSK